ncbi:hypothetical protein O181_000094 [Austropuccinia psidii MF-1]|uniref:Uncharacterized protein n=1 Tax=Austropuccinia psidii MF-1 TaxID=1389203 RepID=A0A9Q3B802_9BASI|nr:hypothetical protein [Austropuccinia psidii MF-1]
MHTPTQKLASSPDNDSHKVLLPLHCLIISAIYHPYTSAPHIMTSPAYHYYASTLTSHGLNLLSLCSHNDWIPCKRQFTWQISNHYAHEKIGFCNTGSASPLYTILTHLHPHIVSFLHSCTALFPSQFTILMKMQ